MGRQVRPAGATAPPFKQKELDEVWKQLLANKPKAPHTQRRKQLWPADRLDCASVLYALRPEQSLARRKAKLHQRIVEQILAPATTAAALRDAERLSTEQAFVPGIWVKVRPRRRHEKEDAPLPRPQSTSRQRSPPCGLRLSAAARRCPRRRRCGRARCWSRRWLATSRRARWQRSSACSASVCRAGSGSRSPRAPRAAPAASQ